MVLQVEIDAGALIAPLTAAAREAGEIALRYFRHGERTHANIEHKSGGSPVTEADLLVDHFLEKRLREIVPDAAWLSEEIADSLRAWAKVGVNHLQVRFPSRGADELVEQVEAFGTQVGPLL